MIGNKKDPLHDIARVVINNNTNERRIIAELNDEIGIESRKELPNELKAEYDRIVAEATSPEKYSTKQKKLAAIAGNPKKIDASDLAAARAGHASHIEEEDAKKEPKKEKTILVAPKGYTGAGKVSRIPEKDYNPEKHSLVSEAAYSAKAAKAGKDIGKPGKMFAKIAKEAGERYGSEESGKNVAGAVLAKIRAKHMKEEILDEATRRHFQMVADLIKGHDSQDKRNELASHHSEIFAKQNPRFDKAKFYKAANAEMTKQLDERAVSKAQHRFFGLVRAIQKGEAKGSPKAEKAASEMSTKEVRKFAKTKEKGLPEKVDENILNTIQEEIKNNLLEKANWLNENGTQEDIVEFLNNLTMEEREILNLSELNDMGISEPTEAPKPAPAAQKPAPAPAAQKPAPAPTGFLSGNPNRKPDNLGGIGGTGELSSAVPPETAMHSDKIEKPASAAAPKPAPVAPKPQVAARPAAPAIRSDSWMTSGRFADTDNAMNAYNKPQATTSRRPIRESKTNKSLEKFLKEDFNGKKS